MKTWKLSFSGCFAGKDIRDLLYAYEDVKIRIQEEFFSTVVDKVSVGMIGENEESIIVIEKELEPVDER